MYGLLLTSHSHLWFFRNPNIMMDSHWKGMWHHHCTPFGKSLVFIIMSLTKVCIVLKLSIDILRQLHLNHCCCVIMPSSLRHHHCYIIMLLCFRCYCAIIVLFCVVMASLLLFCYWKNYTIMFFQFLTHHCQYIFVLLWLH